MAESNQYYIDKYKDSNEIITNFFKDSQDIDITTIVNPLKIDNRQIASMTDNQAGTSHCSGFAVANLFESIYWKKIGKLKNLDANQIYAKAKEMDGRVGINGTQLNFAISAAAALCDVTETLECERIKIDFPVLIETIKFYIHKYDFLLLSLAIHTGWNTCNKNDFTIKPGTFMGYHSVVIVGYDEMGVYIQNSWGINWGYKGFCVLPWNDLLQNIDRLYRVSF